MTAWVSVHVLLTEIEKCLDGILSETGAKGLSPKQVYVLEELYAEDGQTPMKLARAIGQAQTSFTPILDSLVTEGYIQRSTHPKDRRSVIISLTPAGEGLRETINAALIELDEWFPEVDWAPTIQPTGKEVPA